MQQQPHPPAVLNPFRTPNQQLHHHLQHQRNTSNCGIISKDGGNNIYGIHNNNNKNRCMIIANSWIENPILRIGYMMGIAMLLICLMMVGYEAYRKFSNHVTHKFILGPPFSVVTVNTDTHPLPLDNAIVAMDETEDVQEKIVLPEILYKIPPKASKIVSTSSSSSTSGRSVVDGRQSGVRKGSKSSTSSSQQSTKDDDEIVDEEEAGTTDRLPHDSLTAKATDDNVEQILRPKEIHSKLLGLATKDYMQSAIHEEQEQNYHGFGGDINGNQDGVTATASEDNPQDNMVVVLPPRKGEELLKLPPAPDHHTMNDHSSSVVEVPDIQPLPPLEDAASIANAAIVERSRRLRHHVVAIPTSSHS